MVGRGGKGQSGRACHMAHMSTRISMWMDDELHIGHVGERDGGSWRY